MFLQKNSGLRFDLLHAFFRILFCRSRIRIQGQNIFRSLLRRRNDGVRSSQRFFRRRRGRPTSSRRNVGLTIWRRLVGALHLPVSVPEIFFLFSLPVFGRRFRFRFGHRVSVEVALEAGQRLARVQRAAPWISTSPAKKNYIYIFWNSDNFRNIQQFKTLMLNNSGKVQQLTKYHRSSKPYQPCKHPIENEQTNK